MRAILLILILIVVAVIAALATGLVDINQTRPARAPDVDTGNGISASGGQTPAFDVETGSITVGAQQQNITVPVPRINVSPANEAAPDNQAAPAPAPAPAPGPAAPEQR